MAGQPVLAQYDPEAVYHDDEDGNDPGLLDLPNEDWLRSMEWDMMIELKGIPQLVETFPQLRIAIAAGNLEWDGHSPADDAAVKQFLTLPAAHAMPDPLRAEMQKEGWQLPAKFVRPEG